MRFRAKTKFDYPHTTPDLFCPPPPSSSPHPSPRRPPPPPPRLSLFILQWICHSALKYSWRALKNKCVCRKEQKLKRKKLVVLRDAL